jgi:hypothetical protein
MTTTPRSRERIIQILETVNATAIDNDGGKPGEFLADICREAAAELRLAGLLRDRLVAATGDLYYAAHWIPDRPCKAAELWTNLRNAAGLTIGQSADRLGPSRFADLRVGEIDIDSVKSWTILVGRLSEIATWLLRVGEFPPEPKVEAKPEPRLVEVPGYGSMEVHYQIEVRR